MLHAKSCPIGSATFCDVLDDVLGLAVDLSTRFPHAVVPSDVTLAIIIIWLSPVLEIFLISRDDREIHFIDDFINHFIIAVDIDPRADVTHIVACF
jgi:hypothetical protein